MTTTEDTYSLESLFFEIPGEPSVLVEVCEMSDGSLKFTLAVDPDAEMTADIRGLFFDVADETLTDGLTIGGTHVTDDKTGDDSVTNLGGGCNVNGVEADEGGYDVGVEIGTSGMAKDDIQLTEFYLCHDTMDLTLADIEGMEFAARLTSVGTEDGDRDGSLKLSGTAPEAEVLDEEPENPDQPPVDEEQHLLVDAEQPTDPVDVTGEEEVLADIEQPTDAPTDPIDTTVEEEFPLPVVELEEGYYDPYYGEVTDPMLGDEFAVG